MGDYLWLIIGIAVLAVGALAGLVTTRTRSRRPVEPPAATDVLAPTEPRVGEDA